MKKLGVDQILKIAEITIAALTGIGGVITAIKTAKMSEDQMDFISEKTAEKVVSKLIGTTAKESEE